MLLNKDFERLDTSKESKNVRFIRCDCSNTAITNTYLSTATLRRLLTPSTNRSECTAWNQYSLGY